MIVLDSKLFLGIDVLILRYAQSILFILFRPSRRSDQLMEAAGTWTIHT